MRKQTNTQRKIKWLCQAAIIATLYIALTYLAMMFGLDKNAIQVRFSEALCILAYFTSSAIPGLWIGCFLANLLTGCAPLDIVLGPIATLVGAVGAYYIGKFVRGGKSKKLKWLVPIPTIIANMIIVPIVVYVCYTAPETQSLAMIPYLVVSVGIGEVISAGVLGMILLKSIEKPMKIVQR